MTATKKCVKPLTRDVQKIFFLFRFGFGVVFLKKNPDSVRNEFGSIQLKKWFGLDIIVIYYS